MNRNVFTVILIALALFVGYVFVVGNRLPADVRAQIESGQKQLDAARQKIANERDTITRDAAANPDLFRVNDFDQKWQGLLGESDAALNEAGRYAATLEQLRKQNHRGSAPQVQDLLKREKERVGAAVSEADRVLAEDTKRMDLKRDFPQVLSSIQSRAKALAAVDYSAVQASVEKAEKDWPSKQEDLQARLNALLTPKDTAAQWEQTATALSAKPAAELTTDDYAQALQAEEALDQAPGPAQAQQLNDLSHQLYSSFDNVLEDLDKEHDEYREKLKHISTTVPAPSAQGTTSSQELWRDVSRDQWQTVENDVGMTIEHKPLGKYDSEVDGTPQPAGFAYMASPEQGRNQYGYWDHRDGGSFWTWLPEYLILRDLLYSRSYVPIPVYEWDHYYEARRYGQTYYGRDTVTGAAKYGSHGTFTQQHYANSRYVQTGGFGSSKYANASRTAAPSGQRFGSGATDSAGRRYGGSSTGRTFGSSSSSGRSFGSSSRPAGRSFGARRH